MVFEDLAKAVLDFVDWGVTIIIILIIWEVIQLVKVATEKGYKSGPSSQARGWAAGAFKRWRHSSNTKQLNEYLEDQKEAQFITNLRKARLDATDAVSHLLGSKEMTKGDLARLGESLDAVHDRLDEALHEFRKLDRKTLQQERGTKKLFDVMADKGLKVTNLKVYEDNILKLHKETKELLNEAATHFKEKVLEKYTLLKTLAEEGVKAKTFAWPVPLSFVKTEITDIRTQLTDKTTFVDKLELAEQKQDEALKEAQSILAESRKLWTS